MSKASGLLHTRNKEGAHCTAVSTSTVLTLVTTIKRRTDAEILIGGTAAYPTG